MCWEELIIELCTEESGVPPGPAKGPLVLGSCPHHLKQWVGGGMVKIGGPYKEQQISCGLHLGGLTNLKK